MRKIDNEEIGSCVDSLKNAGYPINLNSLIFSFIDNYPDGSWTYFDELSHRMLGKGQGENLTDDEIIGTIKKFKEYVEENK